MESPNSANSLQPQQASCPFYSVMPSENTAMTNLPLLKPAEEAQHEVRTNQSPPDASQKDWVAEPDNEQQILMNAEFQKLLALNEELRAANNDLYEQVEHLKDDLAESEKALQWQKRRSNVTESMLNQQTQELAAAQEQLKSLFQQLETAVQTAQRQEIFIESHKAQLQISQQRLAQLERECALLQTNYSEQSQQVLQSENACRELRTRLMRQQRQTLQFKAALEKCLETTVPSDESLDETVNNSQHIASHQTRFSKKARSLFPNVQPIRPWSSEPESLTNNQDHPWTQSSAIPPRSDNSAPHPSSPWNWPIKEETSIPFQPDISSEKEIDDSSAPETSSSVGSSKLDEQLDSLIQMFFNSESASSSSTVEATVEISQPDTSVWETLATTLEEDEEPEVSSQEPLEVSAEEIHPSTTISTPFDGEDAIVSSANYSPVSFTLPLSNTTAEEPENDHLETSPSNDVEPSKTDLPPESFEDLTSEIQSLSPVVYPERPPKGRKSLAWVELPNFRPNSE
ncbi:hypothetical protein [Halotia branconii]|uniref:Uncharacterized protein n=1 Tax=Halotia branconii CENA392 TaxID=1539056 RepID=A0AAJ6NR93_9CYAN|nr:hypothetical protein [Halotia branconii]WGV25044.1 hypothetical protein QI031_25290 [Halotia branconii CENA392]